MNKETELKEIREYLEKASNPIFFFDFAIKKLERNGLFSQIILGTINL